MIKLLKVIDRHTGVKYNSPIGEVMFMSYCDREQKGRDLYKNLNLYMKKNDNYYQAAQITAPPS